MTEGQHWVVFVIPPAIMETIKHKAYFSAPVAVVIRSHIYQSYFVFSPVSLFYAPYKGTVSRPINLTSV